MIDEPVKCRGRFMKKEKPFALKRRTVFSYTIKF